MATKTEQFLEALAGLRELPEDTCCATKTQSLIIAATERVNALADYTIEEFAFTLIDNTTVTKKIAVYN